MFPFYTRLKHNVFREYGEGTLAWHELKIATFLILPPTRSSKQRCSTTIKGVLRNFAKFKGKYLCQSLFFIKRPWHSCFPVNFEKFLRTPLLQNTSGRLLLTNVK